MSINSRESNETTRRNSDRSLYEKAKYLTLGDYLPDQAVDLVERAYEQATGETYRSHRVRVAEIYGYRSGDQLKCLLVNEDGTRQFVGEDDTATDAGRFTYLIDPEAGDPPVRTTGEALDLLKPPEVAETYVRTDTTPGRQGEWWLLPDAGEPESSVFKPGVGSRPFGPSPLHNHVPREYALGIPDGPFVRAVRDEFDCAPPDARTPHEVFEWAWNHQRFRGDELIGVPDHIPALAEVRDLADGIYVRGTIRHRENDHYLESIGEEWHLAVTHDVTVYTPNSPPENGTLVYEENDDGWMVSSRIRRSVGVD